MKTIAAISTGIITAGISIIRVSGDRAREVAQKLLPKLDLWKVEPRRLSLTHIVTPSVSDWSLVVYFPAPYTFTGEDMVEFQTHGGQVLTQEILAGLLEAGASPAEPGEFSKRAFMNGKMSLDALESVIDLINAESVSEVNASYHLLCGALRDKTNKLQDGLTDLIAQIEVALDYPDEDIEFQTEQQLLGELSTIKGELTALIDTFATGQIIKNGINIAILGKPNVGKSSILNGMLGYDRAIVTDVAGTTRDTVEESYSFGDMKFVLVDTAGIRESNDLVESIGITKSKNSLKFAQLAMFVIDTSMGLSSEDSQILELLLAHKTPTLVVLNKTDLGQKITDTEISQLVQGLAHSEIVKISANNRADIQALKQKIYDITVANQWNPNRLYITNTRHQNCLLKTSKFIDNAMGQIGNITLDCVALDLRNAWSTLAEITGRQITEEVIDSIFTKFCLGK